MLTCMKRERLDGSGLQSEAKPPRIQGNVRKWAALDAFLLLTVFAWSLATRLERVDCNSRKLPGKGGKSMDSVKSQSLGELHSGYALSLLQFSRAVRSTALPA